MPDGKTGDSIGECALHQNHEDAMADVYAGLSAEDRIALAKMITDGRAREDAGPWSQPPEEL